MKTLIISALLAGFGATVVAQEIIPFDDHFVSTRTRAEVRAEALQASASGELYRQQGEITWLPSADASSSPGKTRSEVLAELSQAAASGELYRQQGEITWLPEAGAASRYASRESRISSGGAGSVLLANDAANKADADKH